MIAPDFLQSDADMQELRQLAGSNRLDLFELLRLLSDAGLPVLVCQVDDRMTKEAFGRVARYKLCETLQAVLSALRARNLNADEVESGSCLIGHQAL